MKLPRYIEYILFAVSIIVTIAFFIMPHTVADDSSVGMFIVWAYILLALAIVLLVFFQLVKTFKSPKALKRFLFLILGTVVLIGISYLLAPGSPVAVNKAVSAGTLKFTDTALILTYFVFGGAILALIITSIMSAIRNR